MEQEELFKAQTAWFHVFKSMVDSGDVAAMGAGAVAVYLVVKAYANWKDGRSFPSQKTIAEKTGMSPRTVQRHLATLEKHGYLSIECGKRSGEPNRYTLREKVLIRNSEDEPAAVATWDYLPSTVKAAVAEIRNLALKGDFEGVKLIHIERFIVNVKNLAMGSTVAQFNAELEKITDPELKQQLMALYSASLARQAEIDIPQNAVNVPEPPSPATA
jgi:DNA-binding transcriptional ArsR family regulator